MKEGCGKRVKKDKEYIAPVDNDNCEAKES